MQRARLVALLGTLALAGTVALSGCGGSSNAADTVSSASTSGAANPPAGTGNTGTTTLRSTVTVTTPTHTSTGSAGAGAAGAQGSSDRSPAVTGGASVSGSPGSACLAQQLTLSYLGSQGATGHGELGFSLRNSGRTSCHTYGYPGVLFIDQSGGPLPTDPVHGISDFFGHSTLARVDVAPGASVSFRLAVDHVSSSPCATAYALSVIPPDDTQSLRVAIPGGASECGGKVTVSPLRAGTGAYP